MNSLSLPVVHPGFEKLKRSGVWLHIVAGLLILTHALSHIGHPEFNSMYFWCQLLIAVDIFILVAAGGNSLAQLPRVNLFFRLVEILFFLGISLILFSSGKWLPAFIHLTLSLVYSYLFHCERRISQAAGERLSFHHTGVTIPGIPDSSFFIWSNINQVDARYDSIRIQTSLNKTFDFELQRNLDYEELEQIHEFCRHYLKL